MSTPPSISTPDQLRTKKSSFKKSFKDWSPARQTTKFKKRFSSKKRSSSSSPFALPDDPTAANHTGSAFELHRRSHLHTEKTSSLTHLPSIRHTSHHPHHHHHHVDDDGHPEHAIDSHTTAAAGDIITATPIPKEARDRLSPTLRRSGSLDITPPLSRRENKTINDVQTSDEDECESHSPSAQQQQEIGGGQNELKELANVDSVQEKRELSPETKARLRAGMSNSAELPNSPGGSPRGRNRRGTISGSSKDVFSYFKKAGSVTKVKASRMAKVATNTLKNHHTVENSSGLHKSLDDSRPTPIQSKYEIQTRQIVEDLSESFNHAASELEDNMVELLCEQMSEVETQTQSFVALLEKQQKQFDTLMSMQRTFNARLSKFEQDQAMVFQQTGKENFSLFTFLATIGGILTFIILWILLF